jgi:hypothetical protein
MTGPRKALWAVVILIVVAAAAYLPPWMQLRAARQEIDALRGEARLVELRDHAALMLAEACQRNYGLAGQHASRYFDLLGQAAGEASDPARKQVLTDLLSMRDRVITGLSQGDTGVMAAVDTVFRKTREAR